MRDLGLPHALGSSPQISTYRCQLGEQFRLSSKENHAKLIKPPSNEAVCFES